jgi:hypothetical protein
MAMLPSQRLKAAKAGWLLPPTSSPNQQKAPALKQARTAGPPSLQDQIKHNVSLFQVCETIKRSDE